jgi:hypothetical protein
MFPVCCSPCSAVYTPDAPRNVRITEITAFVLTLIAIAATIYFRKVGSWATPTLATATTLLFLFALGCERVRRKYNRAVDSRDLQVAVKTKKSGALFSQLHLAKRSQKELDVSTLNTHGGNLFHTLAATTYEEEEELTLQSHVRKLIADGFDINGVETEGDRRTPLHIAYESNNPVMVKVLISFRADQSKGNKYGKIPSECAPASPDDE